MEIYILCLKCNFRNQKSISQLYMNTILQRDFFHHTKPRTQQQYVPRKQGNVLKRNKIQTHKTSSGNRKRLFVKNELCIFGVLPNNGLNIRRKIIELQSAILSKLISTLLLKNNFSDTIRFHLNTVEPILTNPSVNSDNSLFFFLLRMILEKHDFT